MARRTKFSKRKTRRVLKLWIYEKDDGKKKTGKRQWEVSIYMKEEVGEGDVGCTIYRIREVRKEGKRKYLSRK